jgi:hypothetical protein
MAAISVTHTFTNGTAADATEVNENFDDIVQGLSDGTKDVTVSAITANGAATFNGTVALGNATGDDITVTGRVASHFDPKTASTYDLGDATQLWRAFYGNDVFCDLGAVGTPSHSFHADTDTGAWSSGANLYNISTGGVERAEFGATESVFNDTGADTDFRVEGDTKTHAIFVDAGNDVVLLGATGADTVTDSIGGFTPEVQLNNGTNTQGMALIRTDNGQFGSGYLFAKSRSGGAIQDNDICGYIRWAAHDGTDYNNRVAEIRAVINGTPGTDDTPGELVFATTADGANSSTDNACIKQDGDFEMRANNWPTSSGTAVGIVSNSGLQKLTYGTSSKRFKKDITELEYDSENIYKLRAVSFTYKNKPVAPRDSGYIAEEVVDLFPQLCGYDGNWNEKEARFIRYQKDGKDIPQTVYYNMLVVPIIEEMKKLRARIKKLEKLES